MRKIKRMINSKMVKSKQEWVFLCDRTETIKSYSVTSFIYEILSQIDFTMVSEKKMWKLQKGALLGKSGILRKCMLPKHMVKIGQPSLQNMFS